MGIGASNQKSELRFEFSVKFCPRRDIVDFFCNLKKAILSLKFDRINENSLSYARGVTYDSEYIYIGGRDSTLDTEHKYA